MNNIEPMAPTLGREPFHRAGWVYEDKVDGWRIVAYRDGARVRLVSRHGVDHTRHFRDIAAAIAKLSARSLVLDGEVAIFDQQLRSRFDWLRDPDPDAVATPPLLMAFDLALCLRATLPVALRHALPRRNATTTTGSARRASTTSGSTSDGRCLARVGLRDAHGRLPRLWRGRIR